MTKETLKRISRPKMIQAVCFLRKKEVNLRFKKNLLSGIC